MKSEYFIDRVGKKEVQELLYTHHYLKDESKDFKSGYNYSLYRKSFTDILNLGGSLGVCIFSTLPVPEIAVGAFGLERNQQEGIYELSRLCIHPDIQKEEYNITSWFLSRCIRRFKKDANPRAIISYADASRHSGIIYRASNFSYRGMTDPKKDFWIRQPNGLFIKHSRGPIKGLDGEWRDRTRKHRFVMVFDKTINILWKEEKWINEKL